MRSRTSNGTPARPLSHHALLPLSSESAMMLSLSSLGIISCLCLFSDIWVTIICSGAPIRGLRIAACCFSNWTLAETECYTHVASAGSYFTKQPKTLETSCQTTGPNAGVGGTSGLMFLEMLNKCSALTLFCSDEYDSLRKWRPQDREHVVLEGYSRLARAGSGHIQG